MARTTTRLLPATEELLRQFGERLRLARQRRRLSAKQVAERAGMNPMTLRSLERGGSGVTIGAYLAVMQVLGLEKELDQLAQADPQGRSLQDARLRNPASERVIAAITKEAQQADAEERQPLPSGRGAKTARPSSGKAKPADEGKFVTSRNLAALLAQHSRAKRR